MTGHSRKGSTDMRLPRIAALAAAAMLVFAACDDGEAVVTPVPDGAEEPAVTTPGPDDVVVEE
jgi:hypothetical protein